jgi:nicotinamidase-related amidase
MMAAPDAQSQAEALLRPAGGAVLVIDVQNDFAHELGKGARLGSDIQAAQQAVAQINCLILAARRAGVPVIYLCVEHSPLTDRPIFKARYRQRRFDPDDLLCATGSWGAALYEGLVAPAQGEPVIPKYGYDGFQDTPLDAILDNRGVRNLTITGLVTNLCVQITAEHAFGLGYGVVVVRDATAGDDEAAHLAALRNLEAYFGPVVDTETVLACWNRSGEEPR